MTDDDLAGEIPPSPHVPLRQCAAGCGRRMFAHVDELTGGGSAPSCVDLLPVVIVEPAWCPVPDDTEDPVLLEALEADPEAMTCWSCTPPAVRDEWYDELNENDETIGTLCEREATRRESTADEVDEQSRLVFGVEPFDADDYGSLA